MDSLENRLMAKATALGFDLAGIAAASEADGFARLCAWLDAGHAGEMQYMVRHREARRHPASILPAVRSVIMVGLNYKPPDVTNPQPGAPATVEALPSLALRVANERATPAPGRISCYAQGQADYHDVLREKLKALLAWLQTERPGCRGRAIIDSAPLLERDFARRAGLGWFGKNTMLLNKRLGSFFFLGGLLVDVDLVADAPHTTSHCGTCTACLDACPTAAFVGPGQLDARRCISYLTIELRGPVPEDLRPGMGSWLFGCDICQDVCPWNRKAPAGREPQLMPDSAMVAIDPCELLTMSAEEFKARFRHTALWRPGREGLARNAAIVLGNRADPAALPALLRALDDESAVVREAAQWALARIDSAWRKDNPQIAPRNADE